MRKVTLTIISFLVLANIFAWHHLLSSSNKYLEVSFLDIGQGDSIFIETPGTYQILIDGGPSIEKVLENLDDEMSVFDKTIDMVVITHPDNDHFRGLIGVLENYDVKNIIWTGAEKDIDAFNELLELIEEEGSNQFILKKGDKITVSDVVLSVLNPIDVSNTSDYNDSSLVLKMDYGEACFLFTGDLSSKEEALLLEDDLDCDVLKVGHHGSKYSTSEEFLGAISPDVAVIQVGDNSYGHPSEEVLTRLQNFDIKILRNDLNGLIKFFSNGKDIKYIKEK